jgi:hypothetical protein
LAEFNAALIRLVREWLDISTELVLASELPKPQSLDPSEKLAEIVRGVGGTDYLSGQGALQYLDVTKFTRVILRVVRYAPREYPQLWGPFAANLSILDALLNCGPEAASVLFSPTIRGSHGR